MRRTFDQLEWLFLNLLAIAAANAVLDVIEEEALCDRVNVLGEKRLEALKADVPEIAEVRGPGFMVAAEFCHVDGTPAPELTNAIHEDALARGLLS